jgi:hypothetical protein
MNKIKELWAKVVLFVLADWEKTKVDFATFINWCSHIS